MKRCNVGVFTLTTLVYFALFFSTAQGQTANNQSTATQCYSGPTLSYTNTTGTSLPVVTFQTGGGANQIPAGHRIVDVLVQVVWSKSDLNSCTPATGLDANVSDVGFKLQKVGGPIRYLAASAVTSGFTIPTTSASFNGIYPGGTVGILNDTITFQDFNQPLLNTTPNTANDTFQTNNDSLNFYFGQDPVGDWRLLAIDDAPGTGPALCIHSYCVTVVTCDPTTITASCKSNPSVALESNGLVTFDVQDLDSISDVSCFLKEITFSPASANCAQVGSVLPVTMTFVDRLDSTRSCVSNVRIVDNDPPQILDCFQPGNNVWGVSYLDQNGLDTFYADSIDMIDNCGPIIKQVRKLSSATWSNYIDFNCTIGFQQFYVRGIDGAGNQDSCIVVINILDTVAPTAVCATFDAYLTNLPGGDVTVNGIDVDGGSFDVCPPISGRWINAQFGSPPVYSCADIGADTVLLIVSDISGNLDTCDTAIINVIDTIAPDAQCQNVDLYLDVSGNASLTAIQLDNGSSDICAVDSFDVNFLPSISYGCVDANAIQAVVLHVYDASGNMDSCTSQITVIDTITPTANCRNINAYLDASVGGLVTVIADSLNDNSVDLCTSTFLDFAINGNPSISFTCADLGANLVNLTVIDSFGNTSVCQSTINVLDTVPPVAICSNISINLDAAGLANLNATQIDGGSSDNCTVGSLFLNNVGVSSITFNCSAINTPQNVTLIVQDANGNQSTCSSVVNVTDPILPTALCEFSYTAQLDASGTVVVQPLTIDSNSFDNCGLGVQYQINGQNNQTYDCTDIGLNVATLTVTDSSGNSATCSSNVIVADNIPPILSCSTTTLYLDPLGSAVLVPSDVVNTSLSSDNCTSLTYTFSNGSGLSVYDCDSVGSRTVEVIASDATGNQSVCQTTLTVIDTILPTAVCRSTYSMQLDNQGLGFVLPSDINLGSYDSCGIVDYQINGADTAFFDCTDIGSTAATLLVLDAAGNPASCVTTITITDNIPPSVVCNDTVLFLDATGVVSATPSMIDGGTTDNCSFTLTINGSSAFSYDCSNIGNNTAFLTATDGAAGASFCSATITIVDTITPIASCQPTGTIVAYTSLGQCFTTLPASTFNDGSADNCSSSLTFSVNGQANVTISSLGLNPITLTVSDGAGNTASCQTDIELIDTVPPNMICQVDTVQLDVNGQAIILPSSINNGSNDECGTLSLTINGQAQLNVDCNDLGSNTVTLIGTDGSGNIDSCSTQVVVEDQVDPQANCNATVSLYIDPTLGTASLLPGQVNNASTDNCFVAGLLLSRSNFTCNDIPLSPQLVSLTVSDQSGNTDVCNVLVTVLDTTAPTLTCVPPFSVPINGPSVSIAPSSVVASVSDNCNIDQYSLNQNTFTCSDLGVNPLVLSVSDSSGNVSTCSSQVTIVDVTDPIAVCNNLTIDLDPQGLAIVSAGEIALGSSDNCGIDTILVNNQDSIQFDCSDIGNQFVSILVRDNAGNDAVCTATLLIRDTVAPAVSCSNSATQYLDQDGQLIVDPSWFSLSILEACGVSSIQLSPDTLDCSNVGLSNSVTIQVLDVNGNLGVCVANLPIEDTIAPIMVCKDTTICLSGGLANLTALNIDGGSIDACGISNVLTINGSNNEIYTCSDIGTQVAVLERSDIYGNIDTCHALVTVQDCTAPTAVCQPLTVTVDASGQVILFALDDFENGSFDDCSIDSSTFKINGEDSLIFNCSVLNIPQPIAFTVSDQSGNVDTCFTTVTILDSVAPTANCILNPLVAVLPSSGPFLVPAFNLNNTLTPSDDNCSISSLLINGLSQDTFDCQDLGLNTAVLTVVDGSGNTDTCHAIVNVIDNTNPTVTCIFNSTFSLDSTGVLSLPATNLVSSTSDNCGIASIQANNVDTILFTCNDIGQNLISVTVSDSSGNSSNCNAVVNVIDDVDPIAICYQNPVQAYITNLPAGATYVDAVELDSASFDNCQISSMLINNVDSVLYTCANIGSLNAVTLTVFDSVGNSSTCTANVEVLDTIAPEARCRDITVQLSNTGIAVISSSAIDSFSTDNCGLSSVLINGQVVDTFNCSNVGSPNVALLSVIDNSGNIGFCNANITVLDQTNPSLNCPGAPVNVFVNNSINNGRVIVSPTAIASAFDTCSIFAWEINGQTLDTFTCADIGTPQLVTIEVFDPSGNSTSCNAILNVLDTFPPQANCVTNLNLALDSSGQRSIDWTDVDFFSSDNCGFASTLINGQSSINYTCDSVLVSPLQVELELIDFSGNVSTCLTYVNLVDNIFPIANCRDTVFVQLDNTPNAGVAVVQATSIDNGSTDACTPLTYLINNLVADTFDCSNVNLQNPGILSVIDANNNMSTCISQIQVQDIYPPTVICTDIEVYLNSTGNYVVQASDLDDGSYDNCGILSTVFSDGSQIKAVSCADTGVHVVTVIVNDIHGNADSCTATITVRDTIKPIAICQGPLTVVDLTNNGIRVIAASDLGIGSDNCGVDSLWVSKDTITCTDIGSVPITLYVQDVNGNIGFCTDTIDVVLDRPTITSPADSIRLCEGDTLQLSATNPPNGIGYSRTWYGPNGQLTFNTNLNDTTLINVDNSQSGMYIFTISPTTTNGCDASDTVDVFINIVEDPIITSNNPCVGDTAIIAISNIANFSGLQFSYTWSKDGVGLSPVVNNDSIVIANVAFSDNGSYEVIVDVDGCIDSSSIPYNLVINALPSAPNPIANRPCEGDSLLLLANPTDSTLYPYTFTWSSNAATGFSANVADTILYNADSNVVGIYYLTITDANGCSSDSSVSVSIRSTPDTPSIVYNQPLCAGDLLELQDTNSYSVTNILYNWITPQSDTVPTTVNAAFLVDADSGYYSMYIEVEGCQSELDSILVTYRMRPIAVMDTFTISTQDVILGESIIANDLLFGAPFTIRQLDSSIYANHQIFVDGSFNYSPINGFFGLDSIQYEICDVICPGSCDTASIYIQVNSEKECFIPNGFSPNGDGVNDNMIVRCKHLYPNAVLKVFSRWGTLVYEGEPNGWVGQFNGDNLPDGTYFYQLKLNDLTYVGNSSDPDQGRVGDTYTGFIVLQR